MLPFWKYRFTYPSSTADPKQSLRATIGKHERIVDRSKGAEVKLFHKLPVFFQNAFNPIFRGTFRKDRSNRVELVGYFRPHLFVMVFIFVFLAHPIYQAWSISQLPDEIPGYLPNWKDHRLEFEYQFFGASIAFVTIGWCIGIPYMRRILKALEESTHADA